MSEIVMLVTNYEHTYTDFVNCYGREQVVSSWCRDNTSDMRGWVICRVDHSHGAADEREVYGLQWPGNDLKVEGTVLKVKGAKAETRKFETHFFSCNAIGPMLNFPKSCCLFVMQSP